jgi:hypothetical protein
MISVAIQGFYAGKQNKARTCGEHPGAVGRRLTVELRNCGQPKPERNMKRGGEFDVFRGSG